MHVVDGELLTYKQKAKLKIKEKKSQYRNKEMIKNSIDLMQFEDKFEKEVKENKIEINASWNEISGKTLVANKEISTVDRIIERNARNN